MKRLDYFVGLSVLSYSLGDHYMSPHFALFLKTECNRQLPSTEDSLDSKLSVTISVYVLRVHYAYAALCSQSEFRILKIRKSNVHYFCSIEIRTPYARVCVA